MVQHLILTNFLALMTNLNGHNIITTMAVHLPKYQCLGHLCLYVNNLTYGTIVKISSLFTLDIYLLTTYDIWVPSVQPHHPDIWVPFMANHINLHVGPTIQPDMWVPPSNQTKGPIMPA
jgi:hypothetical protein